MIKDLPACLYLYSASPRRGELLKRIGIEYMSKPVDVDESFSQVLSSQEIVLRIAMKKLNAGLEADLSHLKNWGLAADTLVEGPTALIGKPENSDEAESMLRSLSGIIHTVHTAIAVYSPLKTSENHIRSLVHSSQVAFRT
ncbi:MAG: Maf family protein, partial [Spirochaetaceae bacterium]|nr:Maf family protein [Spirochaetaceae bacterium]